MLFGQFSNESRISGRGTAAQAVIDVADDQPSKTAFQQPVQQSDGITAAGDANEIAGGGWTPVENRLCRKKKASASCHVEPSRDILVDRYGDSSTSLGMTNKR